MFSAAFLYDNNIGQNYIVTSNCTCSEYIKIYDLLGNKITDVPFHPDNNSDKDEDNNDNNNDTNNNDDVNDNNNNNDVNNNNINN